MNNSINSELLLKHLDDLKKLHKTILNEVENKINTNPWTTEWLEQTELNQSSKTGSNCKLQSTGFDHLSLLLETIYTN